MRVLASALGVSKVAARQGRHPYLGLLGLWGGTRAVLCMCVCVREREREREGQTMERSCLVRRKLGVYDGEVANMCAA